ncbi:DUF3592 domain-containing protein [Kribbella qitaiheensis]|uniref:DUF3592 domain-containing protein n=1 Tax=Kribbella qitaiheensis TaxID=1544730 RepID=UPI00360D631C
MCIVAGILLIAFGVIELDEAQTLADRSEVATGTVLERRSSAPRANTTFVVKFVTHSGRTVVGETWRVVENPKVGDQIQIEYDPDDPTLVQGADWGHNSWWTLIYFGSAALVVALGVAYSFERQPATKQRESTGD